jgi:3-phenylpropionate/trans-cinnamate dioxygenase ferredoxin subunit
MTLVRVATVDEIPENGAKRVDVDGNEIAVVRVDGNFFAVSDICSHEYYHLSEGEVDPDDLTIECPKHGSQFSLVDGRPRSLPAVLPVPVYGVRVQGDDVLVELISSGQAGDEATEEPAVREASA